MRLSAALWRAPFRNVQTCNSGQSLAHGQFPVVDPEYVVREVEVDDVKALEKCNETSSADLGEFSVCLRIYPNGVTQKELSIIGAFNFSEWNISTGSALSCEEVAQIWSFIRQTKLRYTLTGPYRGINLQRRGEYVTNVNPGALPVSPNKGFGLADETLHRFYLDSDSDSGLDIQLSMLGLPARELKALSGDWNNDGQDDLAFYDGQDAKLHLKTSLVTGSPDESVTVPSAPSQWKIFSGKFQSGQGSSIGFYDPATQEFHLKHSLNSQQWDVSFRISTVFSNKGIPFYGDWSGNGEPGVGIYDPDSKRFCLRHSLSDGACNAILSPQESGEGLPVAGAFEPNSETDFPGIYRQNGGQFIWSTLNHSDWDGHWNGDTRLGARNASFTPLFGTWKRD